MCLKRARGKLIESGGDGGCWMGEAARAKQPPPLSHPPALLYCAQAGPCGIAVLAAIMRLPASPPALSCFAGSGGVARGKSRAGGGKESQDPLRHPAITAPHRASLHLSMPAPPHMRRRCTTSTRSPGPGSRSASCRAASTTSLTRRSGPTWWVQGVQRQGGVAFSFCQSYRSCFLLAFVT